MFASFGLGALAQLSLVLSGLAVFLVKVPTRTVGNLAGFGAGALIAAVAADLLPNAKLLEMWQVALWTMLGAGTFILGERYVDRKFGAEGGGGPLGIVVGAIVDGVPESIIFGVQMARGYRDQSRISRGCLRLEYSPGAGSLRRPRGKRLELAPRRRHVAVGDARLRCRCRARPSSRRRPLAAPMVRARPLWRRAAFWRCWPIP